jgi:riboflavin kinase / FMN adenylyltransferase
VSSTSIRTLIQEGKLDEAKVLLGRRHQLRGTVVKGHDRGGKLLGFPTANIRVRDELLPKVGVYAVTVLIEGKTYAGVTNIGYNPTFGDSALSVETHILDFSGELTGSAIRIDFVKRLRDEKKFPGVKELVEQIMQDVQQAREVLVEAR